jgi:alkylation response protein AidB-like acyl-CoA dehydrogenase
VLEVPVSPGFDADFRAQMRATARQVLAPAFPQDPPLRAEDATTPPWAEIAELGWLGIEVPEEYGGLGAGLPELCVLLEEMGRVAFGGPFFASTVLGVGALLGAGDEVRRRWLPALAEGRATVTAALLDEAGAVGRPPAGARAGGSRRILDAAAAFVPDLGTADAVAVPASGPDGIEVFLVETDRDGVTVAPQPTHDLTRRLSKLTLEAVEVGDEDLVHTAGTGERCLADLIDRAAIGLAADSLGGADAMLELTIAYLRDRRQFGVPIGSFQALKHRAVDMAIAVEGSRDLAALAAAAGGEAERAAAASIAKSVATGAFAKVAAESISLHGGIAFTWEHPAHVFLKRAKLSEAWFGDGAWHRRRLGALALGIGS